MHFFLWISATMRSLLLCSCLLLCVVAEDIPISKYGAVQNDSSTAVLQSNVVAINKALASASSGDTVIIDALQGELPYYIVGGVEASMLSSVTVRFDTTLIAESNMDVWPVAPSAEDDFTGEFAHIIHFVNCTSLTITSSTTTRAISVDGRGVKWWDDFIIGVLKHKRPKMLVIEQSSDILIDNLHLLNSPSFHILLSDVAHAEVSHSSVYVDRSIQRKLKQKMRQLRLTRGDYGHVAHPELLQPEDLNTDGIDPSGRDVWIHDCNITNDDDSIAVKPCSADSCVMSSCSENMVIERMMLTGFGASIGSVPPHDPPHCVRNITFRNIVMPQTGKGVYVKSNPLCGDNKTAVIENILYEDIQIIEPRWWAVWIGPQQQHEPGSALGAKCALDYPFGPCPTQDCVLFNNITLRRIYVSDPWLSPGVMLGNASLPMRNIHFDTVVFNKVGSFPFGEHYNCSNTAGTVTNSTPIPSCLQNMDSD